MHGYIAKLTRSLNHAIAVSLKRNPDSKNSRFVRGILLVKGVHFYGFHTSYSPFLKIHIADPAFVNRAATIMQSGTVMKTKFRVFESHLSYILQFLCDYGLYGCGWIDLAEVWQRGIDEDQSYEEYGASTGNPVFKPSPYYRQTRMLLEVDVEAHQILNRHRINARNVHHKLSIPATPMPSEPLVISVSELWEDERRRRVALGLSPSPEVPKDLSDSSRTPRSEWIAEARWWDEVRNRIEKERDMEKIIPSTSGWDRWVMTTFESIEGLWEDQWKTWKPAAPVADSAKLKVTGPSEADNPFASVTGQTQEQIVDTADVDVDEGMLSSQAVSKLIDSEEKAWVNQGIGGRDNEGELEVDDGAEDGPPPEYGDIELIRENSPV